MLEQARNTEESSKHGSTFGFKTDGVFFEIMYLVGSFLDFSPDIFLFFSFLLSVDIFLEFLLSVDIFLSFSPDPFFGVLLIFSTDFFLGVSFEFFLGDIFSLESFL